MAISFSRPDPASPASVSSAQFPTSRRGYDQTEVRDFLRMVAAEQARLQERERFLERELRAAHQAATPDMSTIDEDTATRLLGEEAARVLQTAREAATQIRTRAEEGSARLLREATDEAQRLREEAEIEAARRRQDAAADSEAELQMAKQQGRDMVNEARAYRERVLSELARRRELARQQIEQLIHGRDRLLQAFERSRLAAVEVMAELTPLGEPNEYVNLQPTTGPLPIMVPSSPGPTRMIQDQIDQVVDDGGIGDDADDTVMLTLAPDLEIDADDATEGEGRAEADSEFAPDVAVSVSVEADDMSSGRDPGGILGDETEPTDLRLVEQHENAGGSATPDTDPDTDSDAGPDNVVELFATDEVAPAVADSDGSAAHPESPDAGSGTVDDLFARLRAARSDVVARSVTESAAIAPVVEPALLDSNPDVHGDTDGAAHTDDATGEAARPDPDEVVVPLIVSVARKLKRVLADEQNELLDTLRRKEPVLALDALVPWEPEQADRYADAVLGDLVAAAVAGARGSDDGRNPAITRPATDAVTNDIVAPLRERLTRCIDKADGNNTELASQVRSLYREWKTHRIDEYVEEIVRLAYDRGAMTVATP